MAQSVEVRNSANARMLVSASNLAVAGTGALQTILEILSLTGIHRLWVELKPVVNAFTAFQIQAKFHPNGDYVVIASAPGDFTAPHGVIFGASGDLTVLAAAAIGWVVVDTTGMFGIRFQSTQAAAGGGATTVYAGASS